jgi:hypothetical protein
MIRPYVDAALRGARYDKLDIDLLARILRQAGVRRAEWSRT